MPLYVGDYLSKTKHLGASQHGAYLLLIMHYWQTGGLPDDDVQLARIACCTPGEWRKMRGVIVAFFEPGWKHGRIEEELARASAISEKRRGAAEEMHNTRRANADANAQQVPTQPPSPPQSPSKFSYGNGGGKRAARTSAPRHGATSTAKGRIYINADTAEWPAYAEDYRSAHGVDPVPNEHGGKWFNITGEKQRHAG
jgi:uncharacterized protein YdaU (DUF1376 family)